MSLEVKNTRDLTSPYLATILYGPPKAGKTTFAASLGSAPLVVDFDDGLLTLKDLGVNYLQPRTWEEVLTLVTSIRSGKLRETVQYDHIIWDSHTLFYNVVVQAVLKLSGHTSPSQPEWGMCNDRAKMIYDQLVKAREEQKYHFTLTCHEKIDKDDVTGIIHGGIATTPQLSNLLPAMFDELYYIKPLVQTGASGVKSAIYRIHTLPEGMFPAGTRSRGKLQAVEEANFGAIYRKIVAEKGGAK